MSATLQSHVMARVLASVILTLLTFHLVAIFVLRIWLGHDTVYGLIDLFDFGQEANVPSWFSSTLMLGASIACLVAGRPPTSGDARLVKYWLVLAFAMLFLSADETVRIHEKLGWLFMRGTGRGIFFYGWPAVYGPIVALFGLWMLRFLTLLPRRTGIAFALSGFIYITGAIGMELVESSIAYNKFQETASQVGAKRLEVLSTDVPYQIAITLEEALEMVGLAIFLVTAVGYIESRRTAQPSWKIQPQE